MNFNFNFNDTGYAEWASTAALTFRSDKPSDSELPQEAAGLGKVREQLLLGSKFRGMNTPPAAAQMDGMFEVQHLVVDDVFEDAKWHERMIENTADDNRVVGRVVVTQTVS